MSFSWLQIAIFQFVFHINNFGIFYGNYRIQLFATIVDSSFPRKFSDKVGLWQLPQLQVAVVSDG